MVNRPPLVELASELDVLERDLAAISECLQWEAKLSATADVARLLDNTRRKNALVAAVRARAHPRRRAFQSAWAAAGEQPDGLPTSLPQALRALALIGHQGRRADLVERAARIESLIDSISELRRLNHSLREGAILELRTRITQSSVVSPPVPPGPGWEVTATGSHQRVYPNGRSDESGGLPGI